MKEKIRIDELNFRMFNPLENQSEELPDVPGNYIVALQETADLPDIGIVPVYDDYNGYRVIYTGISKKSLRSRDYRQHFTGNNAGRSTLRKSLGSLMRLRKIPRDRFNPENGKTRFCEKDEEKLSDWMKKNLLLFYRPEMECSKVEALADFLIEVLNPPLNLMKNQNEVNKDYREELKKLRKM